MLTATYSTFIGFLRYGFHFSICLSLFMSVSTAQVPEKVPAVGDKAPEFRLPNLQGEPVQLSALVAKGPVVLVVLRGFPGYQCPACNAQTGQLLAAAEKFAARKAQVVLVYPGSDAELKQKAERFVGDKILPANFHLVVDNQYLLTYLYGLRLDAPNETAYPSTFIVDSKGKIVFAKISKSHGDRAATEEILKSLPTP